MRQRVVETDPHRDFSGMPLLQGTISGLISGRSAAEEHELHAGSQHFLEGAELDVDAFLLGQAGNAGEYRDVGANRKAKFRLQLRFYFSFSGEVPTRIWMRQMRIVIRVPFFVVDAVENTHERCLAPAQNVIQSTPELFGCDFAGVSRADSRDEIRVNNSGLETTHVPVKLQ